MQKKRFEKEIIALELKEKKILSRSEFTTEKREKWVFLLSRSKKMGKGSWLQDNQDRCTTQLLPISTNGPQEIRQGFIRYKNIQ